MNEQPTNDADKAAIERVLKATENWLLALHIYAPQPERDKLREEVVQAIMAGPQK